MSILPPMEARLPTGEFCIANSNLREGE